MSDRSSMGIRTGFSEFGDFVLTNDWALIGIVTLAGMVAIQYVGEWAQSLARKLKYSVSTILALVIAFIIIALTVRLFNWIMHSNSNALVSLSIKSEQDSVSSMGKADSFDSLHESVDFDHTVRNGADRKRSRRGEEERRRKKRSARSEKGHRAYTPRKKKKKKNKNNNKTKKAMNNNKRRGKTRNQHDIPNPGKREKSYSQTSIRRDQNRGATSKRSPVSSSPDSAPQLTQQRAEYQRPGQTTNPPRRGSGVPPPPPQPPLSTAIAAYVSTGGGIRGTIKNILGLAVEGFDSVVDLAKSVVKKRDSVNPPSTPSSTNDGKRSRG